MGVKGWQDYEIRECKDLTSIYVVMCYMLFEVLLSNVNVNVTSKG